jgi:hypothetical protein
MLVSNLRFKEKEKEIYRCLKKMECHLLTCGKALKKNGNMLEKLLIQVHREHLEDKAFHSKNTMKEINFFQQENMITFLM